MCTLTWHYDSDSSNSYTLYFNRDELKTRKLALPPIVEELSGVSYIAPTDADAGGTWIATNQFGLTFCLLNNYEVDDIEVTNPHSRGEIIRRLVHSSSLSEIEQAVNDLPLEYYRGFELVVFGSTVLRWVWDTVSLKRKQAINPVTSSSYETKKIQSLRQQYFKRTVVEAKGSYSPHELHQRFHASHIDENMMEVEGDVVSEDRLVNSVCMHRPESNTVSFCSVSVNAIAVEMRYMNSSPCKQGEVTTVKLQKYAVA